MAEDRLSFDSVDKKALTDEAEVEGHIRSFEPVEKKAGHDDEPEVEGHLMRDTVERKMAGPAAKRG